MNNSTSSLVCFVGMPGAGKSCVVSYLAQMGIPFIRFGDITDEKLRTLGLTQTPENEKQVREGLREEEGMAVYAKRSLSKIIELTNSHPIIGIDGLYSWEEYLFLKEKFPQICIVHVFTQKAIRYERLKTRSIRPLSLQQAAKRDIDEIEHVNKGGPIAIADYLLDNTSTLENLYAQIKELLQKITV